MKRLVRQLNQGYLEDLSQCLEQASPEQQEAIVKLISNVEGMTLYREIYNLKKQELNTSVSFKSFNDKLWAEMQSVCDYFASLAELQSCICVKDLFILNNDRVLKKLARVLFHSPRLAIFYETDSDYELILSCENDEDKELLRRVEAEELILQSAQLMKDREYCQLSKMSTKTLANIDTLFPQEREDVIMIKLKQEDQVFYCIFERGSSTYAQWNYNNRAEHHYSSVFGALIEAIVDESSDIYCSLRMLSLLQNERSRIFNQYNSIFSNACTYHFLRELKGNLKITTQHQPCFRNTLRDIIKGTVLGIAVAKQEKGRTAAMLIELEAKDKTFLMVEPFLNLCFRHFQGQILTYMKAVQHSKQLLLNHSCIFSINAFSQIDYICGRLDCSEGTGFPMISLQDSIDNVLPKYSLHLVYIARGQAGWRQVQLDNGDAIKVVALSSLNRVFICYSQKSQSAPETDDEVDAMISKVLQFYRVENYLSVKRVKQILAQKVRKQTFDDVVKNIDLQLLTLYMKSERIPFQPRSGFYISKEKIEETKSKKTPHLADKADRYFNSVLRQEFDKWSYNVFEENSLERQHEFACKLFSGYGVLEVLHIEPQVFLNFVVEVCQLYTYRMNPFHNFYHALTVTHSMHYLLQKGVVKLNLSRLEQVAVMLACFGHDVDHPGRTNIFEVNSFSQRALIYNDKSVLQNHHCSVLFSIMRKAKSDCNVLDKLAFEEYKTLRKIVIKCILSTDMKMHAEELKEFAVNVVNKEFNENDAKLRELVLGVMVHSCDLSGPVKDFQLSREWSLRVSKEFTSQVREEQERGIKVTAYLKGLDNLLNISKNEISFLKMLIVPLWQTVQAYAGTALEPMRCASENIRKWESVYQQQRLKLI